MAILPDVLRAMAASYPDKIAYQMVDGDSMTFAGWEAESNKLGRALMHLAVAKGDRVGLLVEARDALRFCVAYSAIHKAGAVAVPMNDRLSERELSRLIDHAEPAVILASLERDAQAATAIDLATRSPKLCTPVGTPPAAGNHPHEPIAGGRLDAGPTPGGHPAAKPIAGSHPAAGPAARHHAETGPATATVSPIAWTFAAAESPESFQVPTEEDDLADIMYTSGTTGQPKGVAIRHRDASMIQGTAVPEWKGRSWLHASPLFTFAGLTFVYAPMRLGLSGCYLAPFDTDRFFSALSRYRPQVCFLVPAMAELIVAHPGFEVADWSSIELCYIGSAPLAPATLRKLQERMPQASVSNSYSMTEAGTAYCFMPKGEALRRIGSVGKPLPPLEVRIVDAAGHDAPPGSPGEILLRMPGHQREYYRDPDATQATWEGGWLHTGDLGHLDEDGYLYVTGRLKDVIIRGGNNIHAADVEAVLMEHPEVMEAAVVGIPHPVLGEDIAAMVVMRYGSEISPDELRIHCESRLASYKVPRRIEIRKSLPRNATGKILKDALRDSLG